MKPFHIKNLLALTLLLLFAVATSCSPKEGGDGKKKEADSPPLTDDPGPVNDCFGLLDDDEHDHDHDEGEEDEGEADHDHDEGEVDHDEEAEEDPATDISSGSDDCGDTPSGPTTPDESSTPGVDKTAGPKYKECADQGKAWIPVSSSGAYCGDALVNWCCSVATIEARFAAHTNPSAGRDLKGDIAKILDSGLKLYHCSKTADGKNYFHFAIKEAGKTRYKNIWVKGGETEVADPAECPVVTDVDMGFGTSTEEEPETDEGEDDDATEDDGEEDDGGEDETEDDGEEDDGEDDLIEI